MQKKFGIGIKLKKDCLNISYLMFTDNYFIFCKVTKTAARNVRNILDHYYKVSCQSVNLKKLKIQFSTGVNNAEKRGSNIFCKSPLLVQLTLI